MVDLQTRIETGVQAAFERVGLRIEYLNEATDAQSADQSVKRPELYPGTVLGALADRGEPLDVMIVGANDGKYNDPIYGVLQANPDSTNVLLSEPLNVLLPYLKDHYAHHPNTEIRNVAVGSEAGELTLYFIKKEFWDSVDVSYADGWPQYRAPTGIATSDRENVVSWAAENVDVETEPEEIVAVSTVPVERPGSLVTQSGILNGLDVLQVDAEGMDAEIVIAALNDGLRPIIINFEHMHLSTPE